MKKSILTACITLALAISAKAQTKKDGTPDMRYSANKEMYGTSSPSYSTPSNSSSNRTYSNGGQYKMQSGYQKSNGTYVAPHLKTTPDNNKFNNIKPY